MGSENLHEDISRHVAEEKSSERGLGITFAAVFFIMGLVRLYRGHDWWIASFSVAAIFLFLAYFWVAPLRPLNSFWHRLGLLLSHVVTPIVMGIVFFSTIAPIGILMRLFAKDPLKLNFNRDATTYWQERPSSKTAPKSMNNQF